MGDANHRRTRSKKVVKSCLVRSKIISAAYPMFPGLRAGLSIHIEGFAVIRDGLVSKGRVERISWRTTARRRQGAETSRLERSPEAIGSA